ncbi:DUF1579 domain-containing protein [Bosea caraganae]|uniref:DUF1579 domain-containing protein n=1 Tax=Bosea caraganae TaxID=2763117 RepID=A0A370L8Q7_9HYPH|nr:DUF1579 domain-containing protein [Bosea caraganae]RDJ26770.1 DUF1579 domain-containing protein [Bosea caraganae]RDJ30657.1 DUF1579 domain-containing protein [Bosea caraganae]
MFPAQPTEDHRWLQQLIGDWTYEGECMMGPDKPSETSRGTETVSALGDLWIVGESEGEMPGGGAATMRITLGFDPAKGRFVGSWVGSMMPMLWTYEGLLDADRKVLTLESEGPSFSGDGTLSKYRDIIEIKSPTERLFYSQVLGPDGTWNQFMTSRYSKR